jgi:transcription elongation factor Elf1
MRLNCISCGHSMTLDDAYQDFEGLVKCNICSALLQVKISEAKIKAVNLSGSQYPAPPPSTDVDIETMR